MGGYHTIDFESLARLGIHPFAIDVAFLDEQRLVIQLNYSVNKIMRSRFALMSEERTGRT